MAEALNRPLTLLLSAGALARLAAPAVREGRPVGNLARLLVLDGLARRGVAGAATGEASDGN